VGCEPEMWYTAESHRPWKNGMGMIKNPHLEGDPFTWEGGPTGVLLVHGLTATTAEVRPLARYLYGLGYTVAGPLLPGHNTTPEDANRFRWRDWVRCVEVAYRELAARCSRVVAGGESTGALLALYLASEHPEIAAVLSYAPALRLTLRRRDVWLLRVVAPFKPYLAKQPHANTASSGGDALWRGYPVNPLKATLELLRLQRVVRARLPRVQQPLLVIQGRHDPTVHPSAPEIIYREVGSTVKELHWFDRSAHKVILDDEREQVFDLTRAFVGKALGEAGNGEGLRTRG
jgi:carboxylesterase